MSNEVVHNEAEHRYEIHVDGVPAGFTQYVEKENDTVFVHTEIGDEFGGRGLGSILARQALDDVIARGRTIVPLCPFIKGWIEKHPEYQDHVRSAS